MNIMRSLTLATLVTAAATAGAEETRQSIYLNPSAGFQLFDDKRDLSETATYGIGLEYRFLPRWAVEAVYARGDADRKYAPGNSDFDEYRIDALYYFGEQHEAWNPYLSLGAGHAEFGGTAPPFTAGTDHDETRVNVGAGVRYNISDSISLRGDLREFHGIDESTFDTVASLGISFAFNRTVGTPAPQDSDSDGVMDPSDQCPDTAMGVSVDSQGCETDADTDGVVDSRDQCPNTPAGAMVNSRGCEVDSDNDGVVNSIDQCPDTAAGAKVDSTGCEGVTETVETIELSVNFPNNSSVIGDRFDNEIRRVADFMKQYPETTVEIGGHSDSRGAAEYNQFLSQRRAEAVANRLTGPLGIAKDRVTAVGYGETQPIASNDTESGRAENRRVEARIQVRR